MPETGACRNENTARSSTILATASHFDRARTRPKLGFDDNDNSRQIAALSNDVPSSLQSDTAHTIPIPQWQRELAASRAGRHSRASSIVSTRTRLTVQSDDARSVEIQAGGHSFRISRDGSRVTDVTAPPPYPGPPLDQLVEESDEEVLSVRSVLNDDEDEEVHQQSPATPESGTPNRATSHNLPLRTHVPPGAIQNDVSPEDNQKVGATQVLELPRRLRNMFSLNWPGSASSASALVENSTMDQLRRTQSDSSSILHIQDTTAQSSAKLPTHVSGHRPRHSLPDFASSSEVLPPQDVHTTELMEDGDKKAAEVSKCYNRVMRDLDRENRKKLHERDTEIARLRELLNEKDIVYRQQLRDRDNTIQTLSEQMSYKNITINEVKTQIYNLEEDVERKLEQARNMVEDMWEKRWKEYEKLLLVGLEKKSNAKVVMLSQVHEIHVDDAEGNQTVSPPEVNHHIVENEAQEFVHEPTWRYSPRGGAG